MDSEIQSAEDKEMALTKEERQEMMRMRPVLTDMQREVLNARYRESSILLGEKTYPVVSKHGKLWLTKGKRPLRLLADDETANRRRYLSALQDGQTIELPEWLEWSDADWVAWYREQKAAGRKA